MKVFYMNDEKSPVSVQTRKKGGESWEWDYTLLQPQQAKVFSIDAPEGAVPYIKRWNNGLMMIDYIIDDGNLESF